MNPKSRTRHTTRDKEIENLKHEKKFSQPQLHVRHKDMDI